MAEKKKGLGDALLGLFVVREGESASGGSTATNRDGADIDPAAELIAKYAVSTPPVRQASLPFPLPAPDGQKSRPPLPPAMPSRVPDSAMTSDKIQDVKLDRSSILKKAGLTEDERGRVEKTLSLLDSLPAATPLEVKRQIVGASLQAFGISIEQIVESAMLYVRAFDEHDSDKQKETQAFLEQGTRRMGELEKELSQTRSAMTEQQALQKGIDLACNSEKRRIQDVLDFFGSEAVERATKLSAKLRPGAAS